MSVILFNLERFFDLFYYHKMDLPGARRQQGAPTEKQSGSEDGTLGPNFSSILTSQVASGKPWHFPGLNDFLCKVQCPSGAGSESNSCVFAGLHEDVLRLSASLHPVAWETVLEHPKSFLLLQRSCLLCLEMYSWHLGDSCIPKPHPIRKASGFGVFIFLLADFHLCFFACPCCHEFFGKQEKG